MPAELYLQGLITWDSELLKANFINHLPSDMVADIGTEAIQDYVLLKCSELELLIPDPNEMRKAVNAWATVNERLFSTIYGIEIAINEAKGERVETITTRRNGNKTNTYSDTAGQESSSNTSGSDSTSVDVAGFNSSTLVKKDKTTIDYGGKAGYNETVNKNGHSELIEKDDGEQLRTSNTSEIDVLASKLENSMSALEKIVELFKQEFFIMVY